jgi:hypothetical protein
MKRKHLTETPVCPRERLVIISYTTGLSFALERIGPLAEIITIVFYLLVLYLLALPNTPENPFASIYSESLIKTTCQHLLLLVAFNTLIYRKYYNTPPILVGHQSLGASIIWWSCSWSLYVLLAGMGVFMGQNWAARGVDRIITGVFGYLTWFWVLLGRLQSLWPVWNEPQAIFEGLFGSSQENLRLSEDLGEGCLVGQFATLGSSP